jgi:hypothetical protein
MPQHAIREGLSRHSIERTTTGWALRLAVYPSSRALLDKLGKFKTSMGCLYFRKLDEVDKKVLIELVQASVRRMNQLSK